MSVLRDHPSMHLHIIGCEMCDATISLAKAHDAGWDWFTGRLPSSVHYCPAHRNSTESTQDLQRSREEQSRGR